MTTFLLCVIAGLQIGIIKDSVYLKDMIDAIIEDMHFIRFRDKKGKWIDTADGYRRCSSCGQEVKIEFKKDSILFIAYDIISKTEAAQYCPHCGALLGDPLENKKLKGEKNL